MMSTFLNCFSLADVTVAEQLLASTSKAGFIPSHWMVFLGLAVIIAAIGVGVHFYNRLRNGRELDNTRAMFRDLCRAHDLNKTQIKLLQRLATILAPTCPSALFVDSALWKLPEDARGSKALTNKEWEKVQVLQRVLFSPPAVNHS